MGKLVTLIQNRKENAHLKNIISSNQQIYTKYVS